VVWGPATARPPIVHPVVGQRANVIPAGVLNGVRVRTVRLTFAAQNTDSVERQRSSVATRSRQFLAVQAAQAPIKRSLGTMKDGQRPKHAMDVSGVHDWRSE